MERLTATRSKSFGWTRAGKISTLAGDGHVYATVAWVKGWGSLATGESADGRWTLKRVGFLRPKVTVRTEGSQSDLVVVTMDLGGGGKVTFSDASVFAVKRVGFWHPELILEDSVGRRVFTLKPGSGLGRKAVLTLENEAARSSWRTSLLAMVVWYIALLAAEYDQDVTLVSVIAASTMPLHGHG